MYKYSWKLVQNELVEKVKQRSELRLPRSGSGKSFSDKRMR